MKLKFKSWVAVALIAVPLSHSAVGAEQDLSANARLLAAARSGDTPALTRALASGASPNARNRLGETVLLVAIKKGDLPMAQVMLDAGADVNQGAVNGVTPLMAA